MKLNKLNICPESQSWYKNQKLRENVVKKNNYTSIINFINNTNYDFYEDSPFNFLDVYKYLDKVPNTKFILTLRNEFEWFESFKKWTKHKKFINISNIKFSGHIYCYKKDVTDENKNFIINNYVNRNNQIIEYFKDTGKLLIINLEESDEEKIAKISKFFNIDISVKKYPKSNVNKLI